MALPEAGYLKQLEQSAGSSGDLSCFHVCSAQEKSGDIAPGAPQQLPWVPPASSTLRQGVTATELIPRIRCSPGAPACLRETPRPAGLERPATDSSEEELSLSFSLSDPSSLRWGQNGKRVHTSSRPVR